jgi:hypothetical protein
MAHSSQWLKGLDAGIEFLDSNEVLDPLENVVSPHSKKAVEDIRANNKVRLITWEIFPEQLVHCAQSKLFCGIHVC